MDRPFRIPAFGAVIAVVLAVDLGLMAVFVVQDPFNALLGFGLVGVLSAGYLLLNRNRPTGGEQETA